MAAFSEGRLWSFDDNSWTRALNGWADLGRRHKKGEKRYLGRKSTECLSIPCFSPRTCCTICAAVAKWTRETPSSKVIEYFKVVSARALNQAWAISECRALCCYSSHMPMTPVMSPHFHTASEASAAWARAWQCSLFPSNLSPFPVHSLMGCLEISKEGKGSWSWLKTPLPEPRWCHQQVNA